MVGTRQFDEAAVMQRALDVFRHKGLASTSMIDLALATGVHRGSLYNAYGSKDAIFLTAFEQYARDYLCGVRAALEQPDAHTALSAFVDHVLAGLACGSPARGCLSTRTAAESQETAPAVRERIRAWLQELEDTIEASLRQPFLADRLVLPPRETARFLVTFTRGLAVMERVHQDDTQLREISSSLIRVLVRQDPAA
ncbi:TetR/AcrR family transcriptional regulator [Stappia stellulata]|uniref:TetR/AcrR family transcriptional regulator n=1 Tax=Stappia stellulata TaxID=71235 RepID=UPI00048CC55C|nr:TetR/AcrR family transcriptional regulator [Stappia stellulata]